MWRHHAQPRRGPRRARRARIRAPPARPVLEELPALAAHEAAALPRDSRRARGSRLVIHSTVLDKMFCLLKVIWAVHHRTIETDTAGRAR